MVSHRGPYPVAGFTAEGRAMAMNRIQFQAGLSMAAFFERYGTEALCTAALPIASSMAVSARCFSATPAAIKPPGATGSAG